MPRLLLYCSLVQVWNLQHVQGCLCSFASSSDECNVWPLEMHHVKCREQEQRAMAAEQTRLAERQQDTESLQRRLTHERRQHTSERRWGLSHAEH